MPELWKTIMPFHAKTPASPRAPRLAESTARYRMPCVGLVLLSLHALTLAGCRPGEEATGQVAGWTLVEAAHRHPIVVTQHPAHLTVRVVRGSPGLSPHQRSEVLGYLNHYRSGDGNGRLTISVPNGSPNEVAAMNAVSDLRLLLSDYGLDERRVLIQPYHSAREPQPPIRISFDRLIAEGPTCGNWSANVADDGRNLPYPNFGCATQRNFASQIANPADLLGPRTMTPAIAERRDSVWEKFVKGESTITKKDQDEKVLVKGAQ